MNSKDQRMLAQRIWSSIARFQRRARMAALLEGGKPGGAGAHVTVTEGLALHIIATLRNATVKDVSEVLRLERSWVSRLISSLEHKGAVTTAPLPHDGRSRGISLSSAGQTVLRDLNASRAALMDRLLQPLSREEHATLVDGLKDLADGFGAPDYPASFDPHPADFELARLSWAIGVAGNDFIGTGLNVNQYHLLVAAVDDFNGQPVTLSELHEVLPVDLSTLSRIIEGLSRQGFLRKTPREHDRRLFSVELTDRGKTRFAEVMSTAAKRCATALEAVPITRQKQLAALLEQISQEIPHRAAKASGQRHRLREISGDTDALQNSASTHIAQILNAGAAKRTRSVTKSSALRRFAITEGERVVGVVEYSPAGKETPLELHVYTEGLSVQSCLELLASYPGLKSLS